MAKPVWEAIKTPKRKSAMLSFTHLLNLRNPVVIHFSDKLQKPTYHIKNPNRFLLYSETAAATPTGASTVKFEKRVWPPVLENTEKPVVPVKPTVKPAPPTTKPPPPSGSASSPPSTGAPPPAGSAKPPILSTKPPVCNIYAAPSVVAPRKPSKF